MIFWITRNQSNLNITACFNFFRILRIHQFFYRLLIWQTICFLKLIQNTYRSQTMHLITDGRSSTCYYVMILIILILWSKILRHIGSRILFCFNRCSYRSQKVRIILYFLIHFITDRSWTTHIIHTIFFAYRKNFFKIRGKERNNSLYISFMKLIYKADFFFCSAYTGRI